MYTNLPIPQFAYNGRIGKETQVADWKERPVAVPKYFPECLVQPEKPEVKEGMEARSEVCPVKEIWTQKTKKEASTEANPW